MSDKDFGGSDDLSLPKGTHARADGKTHNAPCYEPRNPYMASSTSGDLTYLRLGLTRCAATVHKIITEVLAADPGTTFAKETRDLLIECCVEFITMISSEANEISEKEAKKTIGCEHITKALEDLGFNEYVEEVMEAASQFKQQQLVREKKTSKHKQNNVPEEELMRQQEELFRSATEKFNAVPQESM
ncbi:negative cofactor 2 transcription regulator complex subunit ncb2 [Elasticomyces elasticus]|nr:negative cofactor 2 transcription regulator complex subunit ncb2 [Elasticomyces elasticus]